VVTSADEGCATEVCFPPTLLRRLRSPVSELSPVVGQMPASAETSIEAVGTYIRTREPDPLRRVKALHDWVAAHIGYDVAAKDAVVHPGDFFSVDTASGCSETPWPDKAVLAECVFARRRGICSGYANLLVALGKVTGDPIVYEHGGGFVTDGVETGHAWNSVDIAGHHVVIDATWDAGYIDIDGSFHKRFSSEYFRLSGERLGAPGDEPPPLISLAATHDDALQNRNRRH
jgi:transglutaminase/protease-like cytokinesis protein 3